MIITIKTKTFSFGFIIPNLVSDSLWILQEKLLSGSSDWWNSGIMSPMHTGPQEPRVIVVFLVRSLTILFLGSQLWKSPGCFKRLPSQNDGGHWGLENSRNVFVVFSRSAYIQSYLWALEAVLLTTWLGFNYSVCCVTLCGSYCVISCMSCNWPYVTDVSLQLWSDEELLGWRSSE